MTLSNGASVAVQYLGAGGATGGVDVAGARLDIDPVGVRADRSDGWRRRGREPRQITVEAQCRHRGCRGCRWPGVTGGRCCRRRDCWTGGLRQRRQHSRRRGRRHVLRGRRRARRRRVGARLVRRGERGWCGEGRGVVRRVAHVTASADPGLVLRRLRQSDPTVRGGGRPNEAAEIAKFAISGAWLASGRWELGELASVVGRGSCSFAARADGVGVGALGRGTICVGPGPDGSRRRSTRRGG